MGDDVRNAGLISDTDWRRILVGRHLGKGVDSGFVYDDDDDDEVGGGKEVKRDEDDNEVGRCLGDNKLVDDASLSIVPLLSYNSSSQTNIRRAISKISVGPPESVVRLGGVGGIEVSSSFVESFLLSLLPSNLSYSSSVSSIIIESSASVLRRFLA